MQHYIENRWGVNLSQTAGNDGIETVRARLLLAQSKIREKTIFDSCLTR